MQAVEIPYRTHNSHEHYGKQLVAPHKRLALRALLATRPSITARYNAAAATKRLGPT
jgi:hypothetical protein